MPSLDAERRREVDREYYARHKDDPEFRARLRAKAARTRAKKTQDPDWVLRRREARQRYETRQRSNPEYLRRRVEKERQQKRLYPERYRAAAHVHAAIRRGQLIRPSECQHCKQPSRVEAHHEDYDKPLDVVWLCKSCHVKADRKRRERVRERG